MSGTQLAITAGIGLGLGVAATVISQSLGSVLDQASRYLETPVGTIIPDVTVEESGADDLAITEHPVERGAAITDHSFKHPAEVTMKLGWSNSSLRSAGSEDYVRQVYALLLSAQAARQPFTAVTGKRVYDNLLIQSIRLRTDAATEYALMIDLVLKEIIIVDTVAAAIAPQANHAMPAATAPVIDQGSQTPVATASPANSSGLNSIVGLFR